MSENKPVMKLWRLYVIKEVGPKYVWQHDCAYGFIVRAETETQARKVANANAGDERFICNSSIKGLPLEKGQPWEDVEYTACEELTTNGLPEVILTDFLNG